MIPLPAIEKIAATTPAGVAVVDDASSLRWDDYADAVRRLSRDLARRLDPTQRQRAVVIAGNSVPYVVLASALATLGIPRVGLDPAADPGVLAHQLREVDPTVVAGSGRALDSVGGDPLRLVLDGLLDVPAFEGEVPWTKPEFTALGFTSGTTGLPKLVVRTSPSEARRTAYFVERYGFSSIDTHLVTVPFSHASGHGWASLFLTAGATVVVTADPTPARLIELAVCHGARTTLMVPPVLAAFVEAAEQAPGADLRGLRFVLTGGRQVHPRLLRRAIDRLGPVVTTYYGTTETGVNLVADSGDLLVKPLTCGRPLPDNHVLVLDDDQQPVRAGTVGRVALASYMAMSGYADQPGEVVQRGGLRYLLTADYGRLDAHQQLTLLGRDDGLPAAAGVPVIPIEADVLEIDGIADAAVVRNSAPQGNPVVTVAIVPTFGADIALLVAQAELVLDYHLAMGEPRRVAVIPAVPYGRTGKVLTDDLRRLVEAVPLCLPDVVPSLDRTGALSCL